ncbi:hypothetical protein GUJ93_ZPchr0458g22408 [Zizania palustris]|uniref:Uncharacterized protein n=1 Tax=Zizania palustris TaxID=103762 RepID=A0A8J5RDK8_ZIZPA|nr:hypothetical protein GUJ93_ZPchr0458g22408 [Zizania palustris]
MVCVPFPASRWSLGGKLPPPHAPTVVADLVTPQIPGAIEVVAAASSASSSLVGWPASPRINTTVNLLPLILRDVPLLTAVVVVVPNPISRHPYFHPSATYISPEGVSLLHIFFDLASATPRARRRIVPRIRLSSDSFDALIVLEGTGIAVIVGVPNELLRPSLPPGRPSPPGSMKTQCDLGLEPEVQCFHSPGWTQQMTLVAYLLGFLGHTKVLHGCKVELHLMFFLVGDSLKVLEADIEHANSL